MMLHEAHKPRPVTLALDPHILDPEAASIDPDTLPEDYRLALTIDGERFAISATRRSRGRLNRLVVAWQTPERVRAGAAPAIVGRLVTMPASWLMLDSPFRRDARPRPRDLAVLIETTRGSFRLALGDLSRVDAVRATRRDAPASCNSLAS